jgi:hypothetical protein
VRDESGTDILAVTGDDVEHAGGEQVLREFGEPQDGERGVLRRLEHQGVPGQHGR